MDDQFPTLDAGVTYLDGAASRALYPLVGHHLDEHRGPAYWVDARNAAIPAVLGQHLDARARRSLKVARAFTGYQHYELVRDLPHRVRPTTTLVVAPNVAAPYAEDDVPEYEAEAMFDATLELLAGVGQAVDAPVLVTAGDHSAGDHSAGGHCERVRAAADRVLTAEETPVGLRVEGPSFQPDVYWHDRAFQTTIPYWVDLLGVAPGGAGVPDGVFGSDRGGQIQTELGDRESWPAVV